METTLARFSTTNGQKFGEEWQHSMDRITSNNKTQMADRIFNAKATITSNGQDFFFFDIMHNKGGQIRARLNDTNTNDTNRFFLTEHKHKTWIEFSQRKNGATRITTTTN